MKKTLVFILTIALAILMISTATAVPVTNAYPKIQQEENIKELTERLETLLDSKWYKKLDVICDKYLTPEQRKENKEVFMSKLVSVMPVDDPGLPGYDLFVDMARLLTIVVDITMVFFGHNPIGMGIGFIVATIIAIIPCIIFDFAWSLYLVDAVIYEVFKPIYYFDWQDVVEPFGLIGLAIAVLFVISAMLVMAVLYVILTPLVAVPGIFVVIGMLWEEMFIWYEENPYVGGCT